MPVEPKRYVRFLTVDEARAIHERLVARFGGLPGVRDEGLLMSILYRPRTGCYADLAEMAAALLSSFLTCRPFDVANKRSAFFLADVFLRLNGYRLEAEAASTRAFLRSAVVRGTTDFDDLLPVVRGATVRLGATWLSSAVENRVNP